MLIILEGADGVGKTTLAQQLADRAAHYDDGSVEVWKKGPPTAHPLDEYVKPLLSYRPGRQQTIICDRWHWGERVYPYVLDRESHLTVEMFHYVELFLRSRGAVVLHMKRHLEPLMTALAERGDDLVHPRQLNQIVGAYEDVKSISNVHSMPHWYHWSTPHHVLEHAQYLERLTAPLARFTTYVGSHNPEFLLLGDIRHGTFKLSGGPAFGPYAATSGQYLLKALVVTHSYTDRLWGVIGLANACDVDHPGELWETLGKPRIVTFGVNAHLRIGRLGLAHSSVPHPQYVRRFHHHDDWWYGELINTAINKQGDYLTCRP